MREHDRSRMRTIDETAGHGGHAGAAPVLRIDGPHDGGVAELGEHEVFDAGVDRTVRRAHEVRAHTGHLIDGVLGFLQLVADLLVGAAGEAAMRPGVIADLMAFRNDAAHDGGISLHQIADEEEGAFDVSLLEDVEQLRSQAWVRAVVKGHRQCLLRDFDG